MYVMQQNCNIVNMYLIFCVFCAIIEIVLSKYHPVDGIAVHLWNPRRDKSNWPNKYKLTGNTVCCCKSPQEPKRNTYNDYYITLVDNIAGINCTEKTYHTADCHCFLSRNSFDAQENANDNSCTSLYIYIYIGAASVILLIALLIYIILLLKKRQGFNIVDYRTRRPTPNNKRITFIRRPFNQNYNAYYNNKKDDTITSIKYGSLKNNREYSHIYHSLDNVHMATVDSTPVTNLVNYEKYGYWAKLDSIEFVPMRLPIKSSNVAYEEPIARGVEHNINGRRPFPLPHENVPPANNLSQSVMKSTMLALPPPPKKNPRPPPRTPTIPTTPDASPMTSELINLFNKRRLNGNGAMASSNSTQTSMVLPTPPPRPPNELASAPPSHLENKEDDDWPYEELINVSIYNVK